MNCLEGTYRIRVKLMSWSLRTGQSYTILLECGRSVFWMGTRSVHQPFLAVAVSTIQTTHYRNHKAYENEYVRPRFPASVGLSYGEWEE